MDKIEALGPLTKELLEKIGHSKRYIRSLSNETEMLRDMNIYGEEAIDEMASLIEYFDVDMSGFYLDKYFPVDGSWEDHFLRLFRFLRHFKSTRPWINKHVYDKYPKITLGMLEVVLEKKKWCF